MTSIGKRPIYAISQQYHHHYHHHHQQWPLSKRPRHVTTPTSAISVITAEDDVVSTHNPSDINYSFPSPTYTISFSTSSTPQFQQQPHHQQPQAPLESPYDSPTHQTSPSLSLRSHHEIAQDIHNSFATGHTQPVAWNNEMLIHLLANELEHLCYINRRNGASAVSDQYHTFFSQYKQPFELDFYIRRLVQYSNCSTAAFIIMLVYLDRIQENCTQLLVTEMNCHRLLCTALVLAIKYLDDEVFSNSYYARVGGVTSDEMNQLELTLLDILDWNLSVSPKTFSLYEQALIESATTLSQQHLPCSPTSAA